MAQEPSERERQLEKLVRDLADKVDKQILYILPLIEPDQSKRGAASAGGIRCGGWA